jgi:hypothetical protein
MLRTIAAAAATDRGEMKPRLTIETIPLDSRGGAAARAFVDQLRLYSMADDISDVILGFDPPRQDRDHLLYFK